MIKKDTIVSTTDGRLTLLQWLKKVEAALKNASATAVKGVPQADGKVVFEIDFADGTSIKSDPFELPEKLPEGYAVDASGNVTLNGGLLIDKLGNVEMGKNAAVDGTLTLNTPQNLIFKTGSINPKPEGYDVDDAGNVTIAGALTANNNGNVEVNGKELYLDSRRVRIRSYKEGASDNVDFQLQNTDGLYKTVLRIRKNDVDGGVKVDKDFEVDGNATFSGKNSFIWHGTLNEPVEGMTVTQTVSGLFFHGAITTVNGQTAIDPGIFALIAYYEEAINFYLIKPMHYDPATQENRPATVEEILSGNWSLMASMETGIKLIAENSEAKLKALGVDNLDVANTNNNPVISGLFKVSWEDITLQDIAKAAKKVNGKSDAKYQHTVHITALSDADKQLNISFTAMSSKITPVISYEMLHENFGGCNLTVSGLIKYYAMGVPIHLDLHGGTIETDKLYFVDATSAGAYQQPTLSSFPNITFTDDVTIPK